MAKIHFAPNRFPCSLRALDGCSPKSPKQSFLFQDQTKSSMVWGGHSSPLPCMFKQVRPFCQLRCIYIYIDRRSLCVCVCVFVKTGSPQLLAFTLVFLFANGYLKRTRSFVHLGGVLDSGLWRKAEVSGARRSTGPPRFPPALVLPSALSLYKALIPCKTTWTPLSENGWLSPSWLGEESASSPVDVCRRRGGGGPRRRDAGRAWVPCC